VHETKNVAFYDISYLCLCYRLVDRELSRNFLVVSSRRQVDHHCNIQIMCTTEKKHITGACGIIEERYGIVFTTQRRA